MIAFPVILSLLFLGAGAAPTPERPSTLGAAYRAHVVPRFHAPTYLALHARDGDYGKENATAAAANTIFITSTITPAVVTMTQTSTAVPSATATVEPGHEGHNHSAGSASSSSPSKEDDAEDNEEEDDSTCEADDDDEEDSSSDDDTCEPDDNEDGNDSEVPSPTATPSVSVSISIVEVPTTVTVTASAIASETEETSTLTPEQASRVAAGGTPSSLTVAPSPTDVDAREGGPAAGNADFTIGIFTDPAEASRVLESLTRNGGGRIRTSISPIARPTSTPSDDSDEGSDKESEKDEGDVSSPVFTDTEFTTIPLSVTPTPTRRGGRNAVATDA